MFSGFQEVVFLSDYRHPQFTMIYEVAALVILSLASLTSAQHPPPNQAPPPYQPFPPQQALMDQTTMLMMVMMMQKVRIL